MDEEPERVTITIEPSEANFLVTILRASSEILTILVAFQKSMPNLSPPAIGTDAIVYIRTLADRIEQQLVPSTTI